MSKKVFDDYDRYLHRKFFCEDNNSRVSGYHGQNRDYFNLSETERDAYDDGDRSAAFSRFRDYNGR